MCPEEKSVHCAPDRRGFAEQDMKVQMNIERDKVAGDVQEVCGRTWFVSLRC